MSSPSPESRQPELLTPAALQSFLAQEGRIGSQAWAVHDGQLCVGLHFANFVQAFAFMTAVAQEAERLNHHPEWRNVYNRVDIALSTHDANGLTPLDLHLARAINEIYARLV